MATLNDALSAVAAAVQAATADLDEDILIYPGPPHPQEVEDDVRSDPPRSHVAVKLHSSGKSVAMPIGNHAIVAPIINATATLSSTQLQGGAGATPATATITFGGTVDNDPIMMLIVDGNKYVSLHPANGLSLTALAAYVAAQINADADVSPVVTATAVGPVLTLTAVAPGEAGNAITVDFRIGGTGQVITAVDTQSDTFAIDVMTSDDVRRRLIADTIDAALRDVNFLQTAAEEPIRLWYKGRIQSDVEIRLGVYRRILHYTVEYSMTRSTPAYTVLEGLVTVAPVAADEEV